MDKISELIINIKNAFLVGKKEAVVYHSSLKERILNLLKKEGYIEDYKVLDSNPNKKRIRIIIKYNEDGTSKITDVKRISKPSKRIYKGYKELLPVKYGHGLLILSSPAGVITDKTAKKEKTGGEALFEI